MHLKSLVLDIQINLLHCILFFVSTKYLTTFFLSLQEKSKYSPLLKQYQEKKQADSDQYFTNRENSSEFCIMTKYENINNKLNKYLKIYLLCYS